MGNEDISSTLEEIYKRLLGALGPQHWWPGETPFEVMVGAVLTQNTAWSNVEKAIRRLKDEHLLVPGALHKLRIEKLQELIKPSGFYRVKARRLAALVGWLMNEFTGNIERMFDCPLEQLRPRLLEVPGIGPETADSILLYAGGKPTFVIDAYTRRIFCRHQWAEPDASYDKLKGLFEGNLPGDAALFNEYHALLVVLGKNWCKPVPLCGGCPLEPMLPGTSTG